VFNPLLDSLLFHDPYLVLADFEDYVRCQREVGEAYRDRARWIKMSILNVARVGRFSSDRTILDYNRLIWHTEQFPITSVDQEDSTLVDQPLHAGF